MQILPTADQIHILREYGEPIALPFIYWVWRAGIAKLKAGMNEIITDNVNRIRDEMTKHIDTQITAHTELDTAQFADLRKAMKLPPG